MNGNPLNSEPYAPPGLVLGRCGSATPIQLEASAVHVNSAFTRPGDQIGADSVTWYDPGDPHVHLYEIQQARRTTWVAPYARSDMGVPAAIAHTGYAVIVGAASHQVCHGQRAENCHTDS